MKLLFFLTVFISVFSFGIAQQPSYSAVKLNPEEPKAGTAVTIQYKPVSALQKAKSILAYIYVLHKNDPVVYETELKKSGKNWVGTVSLHDSAAAFVIVFADGKTIDNNSNKGYSFLIFGEDGEPTVNSYLAMANISQNHQFTIGVERDDKKSAYYRDKYYEKLADRLSDVDFNDKLDYFTYKKDTAAILKLIVSIPTDKNAGENEYNRAVAAAKQIRQAPLANLLENVMKIQFPAGKWRISEASASLSKLRTGDEKLAFIKKYEKDFPEVVANNPSEFKKLSAGVALDYARQGRIKEAFDLNLYPDNIFNRVNTYFRVIQSSFDNSQNSDETAEYSQQMLNMIEGEKKNMTLKPAHHTRANYLAELNKLYARLATLHASILQKQGKDSDALTYLQAAVEGYEGTNLQVNEQYTKLLEKIYPDRVNRELENFVKSGHFTEAMKEQLRSRYHLKYATGFDNYFAKLEEENVKKIKKEIEKSMIDEAAPGFTLKNMKGETVSLENLRGKVVVLDFWATWCGPCKASFPAMQKSVNQFKDDPDVVFLFIDTWERQATEEQRYKEVTEFIEANKYSFNVLYDEKAGSAYKVVSSYKVEGIPTKLVIDKKGRVRFRSVGFHGNEMTAVKEMEHMIKLAAAN